MGDQTQGIEAYLRVRTLCIHYFIPIHNRSIMNKSITTILVKVVWVMSTLITKRKTNHKRVRNSSFLLSTWSYCRYFLMRFVMFIAYTRLTQNITRGPFSCLLSLLYQILALQILIWCRGQWTKTIIDTRA